MKVQGYAVELGCSFSDLSHGSCDHGGVVALVFDFEGNFVGQSCGTHLYHAMNVAAKEVESV